VQELAPRAHIDIAILVEREVGSAQRAILTPGLVNDQDVRRDLLLVDQPIERRRRAVGLSAASCSGFRPKLASVPSIIAFAAPTSAWPMAREASTSIIALNFTSMR
jgi:hypothetical protein